jgi:hypothetical protein
VCIHIRLNPLGERKNSPCLKKVKMKEQIIPAEQFKANKEMYLKQLKYINKLLHQPITKNEKVIIKIIDDTIVISIKNNGK